MIRGMVNGEYEAIIRIRIQDAAGFAHEVDAIIDTGFNGYLTLPPALIAMLGLTRLSRGRALLANGSEELVDIYGVNVEWDGQQEEVEVDAIDAAPLVGMSLMDRFDLHIEVMDGGDVIIEK